MGGKGSFEGAEEKCQYIHLSEVTKQQSLQGHHGRLRLRWGGLFLPGVHEERRSWAGGWRTSAGGFTLPVLERGKSVLRSICGCCSKWPPSVLHALRMLFQLILKDPNSYFEFWINSRHKWDSEELNDLPQTTQSLIATAKIWRQSAWLQNLILELDIYLVLH